MKPMCSPAQDGRCVVAPLWPQAVQRAHCRIESVAGGGQGQGRAAWKS